MDRYNRLMMTTMLLALAVAAPAKAQVHQQIPEDGQPPFYADLAVGYTPHTDTWAAVTFFRSPECTPGSFNLLEFLDFSGQPSTCALHIEGRLNWASLNDPYPASSEFWGTGAVPVWFVRWSELEAAVADDYLTVVELAGLPSLTVGSATFFHQTIRNDTRGKRGGNSSTLASGTLTDGRRFFVQFTEKFRDGTHLFPEVSIRFR